MSEEGQTQGQVAAGTPEPGTAEAPREARQEQQAPRRHEAEMYSSRDVDKLKGQARKEARERAEREYAQREAERLERFGVETQEELDALVEAGRERAEAETAEIDKVSKRATKAETKLAEKEAELESLYEAYAQLREDNALRDAFVSRGVPPEKVATLLKIGDRDLLGVDDDGNLTGVEDFVGGVENELPEVFPNQKAPRPNNVARSSNPGAGGNGSEHALRGGQRLRAYFNGRRVS